MHRGRLPAPASPEAQRATHREGARVYRAGSAKLHRRAFLAALGVFAAGAGVGGALHRVSNAETTLEELKDDPNLPGWLREMLAARPSDLILRAGGYERRSRQHRGEPRVVPAFERLMRVAFRSSSAAADAAGASALRTLAKMDRMDLVAEWQRKLESRDDLPMSRATGTRLLKRAGR